MSKRRGAAEVSVKFNSIHPKYEEEVLAVYADLIDEDPDVYLKSLPKIFARLKIPKCFTKDILTAVDYYYQVKGTLLKYRNTRTDILLQLIQTLTITGNIENEDDIIDIIDVDKLLVYVNKLLQFRDNYRSIKETWGLFIEVVDRDCKDPVSYKLTLKDLQKVKTVLHLDGSGKQTLSDVLLIDMLSCCSVDDSGNVNNFEFSKTSQGLAIGIKDFAYILGSLGEFD